MFDTGAVGDPAHQQHDWEPGIAPSGLVWTIPVSKSAIDASPGSGRARFHAENLAVPDLHDFFSSIGQGEFAPRPGHVSFDVRWAGGGDRRAITDATFGFTGRYVTGPATIAFTARDDDTGIAYTADAAPQRNPGPEEGGAGSPAVGHERNGRFF